MSLILVNFFLVFLSEVDPQTAQDRLQNIKLEISTEMEETGKTNDWSLIDAYIKFFKREFGDLPRNNVLRRAFCR